MASIVLICKSLWIKASAKLINVNVERMQHIDHKLLYACFIQSDLQMRSAMESIKLRVGEHYASVVTLPSLV